jgi:hypothetical protein
VLSAENIRNFAKIICKQLTLDNLPAEFLPERKED